MLSFIVLNLILKKYFFWKPTDVNRYSDFTLFNNNILATIFFFFLPSNLSLFTVFFFFRFQHILMAFFICGCGVALTCYIYKHFKQDFQATLAESLQTAIIVDHSVVATKSYAIEKLHLKVSIKNFKKKKEAKNKNKNKN